jgi:hypothetical protein
MHAPFTVVVLAALALAAAACSSPASSVNPLADAQGTPEGSGSSAGSAAPSGASSGGLADAATVDAGNDALSPMSPDAASTDDANPGRIDDATGDANPDTAAPAGGEGGAGNTVLYIGGAVPTVGLDKEFRQVLAARNLVIQDVRDNAVQASDMGGKRLIILSYSVDSATIPAASLAALAMVPVPMVVTEHVVLGILGITTSAGHGEQGGVTAVSIISNDPLLAAGFPMGNLLTIYGKTGEFFWGNTGPGAINVATVAGDGTRITYFAYPAGAMMAGGVVAPAKRLVFPSAAHSPPPDPIEYLNADGMKLLGGAIDWLLK